MLQISAKNLTIGYGRDAILSDLNFKVNRGNYIFITGENGSGKSTLMDTVLKIRKPISGEVYFEKGISQRDFGYLTQQSEFKNDFPASVWEIVMSGFQSKNKWRIFYSKKQHRIAIRVMIRLNILSIKDKSFRKLSGGQRQRVLIARAICATKKILFLDEPITGLDTSVRDELYEIINELNANYNITVIMISHDVDKTLQYATHVLYVGKDIFFGSKNDYLTNRGINIKKELYCR